MATGTGAGVWRQDPNTGVWGWSASTDPTAPIDTSYGQDPTNVYNQNNPYEVGQPMGPGGTNDQSVYADAPATTSTQQQFSNPLDYISWYQQNTAASPQAAITLLNNLQSQYGWNRWTDPVYGASNNETTNNGQKWKVYSEGGNSWYIPGQDDGGGSAQPSAIQPNYTATVSGPSPVYSVPQATAPASSALDDATRAKIMQLLDTPQTVDPNTLRQSPEFRAKALGEQRSEERQRAQLAEEASGGGWSTSGGFNTALAGIRQARGENESDFLGQLAATKMQQNRADLVQGIQFAMSAGQFDKAQQLQAQLANIDAAIREQQLSEQARQYNLGLGFNYDQLGVNANRDAVLSLL